MANDGIVDSSVRTASLTVTAVNDAPVALAQSVAANAGTALSGALQASDVESVSLTYRLITGPAHGTVVVSADGTFTYTSAQTYNGTDSFTFRANDGLLDSNLATVTIAVAGDVTAPTLTLPGDQTFEATSAAGAVVHYAGATAVDASGSVTIEYSRANDALVRAGAHGRERDRA